MYSLFLSLSLSLSLSLRIISTNDLIFGFPHHHVAFDDLKGYKVKRFQVPPSLKKKGFKVPLQGTMRAMLFKHVEDSLWGEAPVLENFPVV